MKLLDIIKREKKPTKGLFSYEWAMALYMLFTLVLMLILWSDLVNPLPMLKDRAIIVVATAAAWGTYRLWPCRLTALARVILQMALLALWYPDTYEFNRIFPNLDHVFAGWEQELFGCQPSVLFSQVFAGNLFSELMCLGYASYYPMIALVAIVCFFCHYDKFHRTAFIILAGFFVYYVIFVFVPVAGPQYYYPAAGMGNIINATFPNIGHYFMEMREALPTPGYEDGLFHQMVVDAHNAGERPTAAFPSSHVGVTSILMILAWKMPSRRLFWILMPFYILMCMATVYIYAHYAIDVIAGWISAVIIYSLLFFFHKKYCKE